jgi:hypothetical protein
LRRISMTDGPAFASMARLPPERMTTFKIGISAP